MSEHSIEELERQLKAAEGRRAEATRAVQEAEARLKEARLDATGLKGHLVKGSRWSGSPEYTILVEEFRKGWRSDDVSGRVLKKNGQLGVQTMDLPLLKVSDLGPYVEPAP
ncbi:hypothetical protein [Devosia elaeis]|uniref:Uncharacterized protein n=1 Tax=Devosia elaeis TaxID=1770058 RepID=A0A178I4P7_9HYPH|nr:hypothetical protein [Devosia elaeis]OAM84201.1 hypothetical protein A3840_00015 [Devosia elaeis]